MKLVIIESPYAGDPVRNAEYARAALLDSLRRSEAPIASHLLYTQVLNDDTPDERRTGIEAGLAWGGKADLTAVYADLGVSAGMRLGIARAEAAGRLIDVRYLGGAWAEQGTIYGASRTKHAPMWRKAQDAGLPVVSRWVDEAGADESGSKREPWSKILADVPRAQRLVAYVEPDDFPICGVLVEVGIALAHGLPVTVVAPDVNVDPVTMRPFGSWVAYPGVTVVGEWPAELRPYFA